jgi:DNA or RNA helicases of superfamily II
MSELVKVEYINAVHMKVSADSGTLMEISDHFSFRPEGYQFSPKFKARVWDGIIRLFQPMKPKLYVGLYPHLKKFCDDRGYILQAPDEIGVDEYLDDDYAVQLANEINCKFTPRDYQNDYVVNALRKRRSLSLSPTSSGKSLIIYLIQQHYYQAFGHRTLIIVPTISLVHQMAGDFIDYGCDESVIYRIQGGIDKNTKAPIVISTWQSLIKQPKDWFDQFRVVLGDEAHTFQAKSLTTIMEKLTDCEYRHGFTGTLKSTESKTHRLILEGCFGEVKRYVSTKRLMEEGTVADFKVKAIVLSHNNETRKNFKKAINNIKEGTKKWPAEREFIVNHEKRNKFITNLVHSLEGQNNLILFDLVEKHGKVLKPLLEKEGRELHFIYGGTSGEERERIRHLVENDPQKQHDILASYGVFSTGVNLKRLDNVIFASGSKSEIKVLQSIGRTLRKADDSNKAVLYDIADDLSVGESFVNYTLAHFKKRIEIYGQEQFEFKIFTIEI